MTHPNPKDPQAELREAIKENIEQHLIAYGCKVCGGGGTDDNNEVCAHCKGLGIVDFETKYIVDKLEQLFQAHQQELVDKQTSELRKIERDFERTQRVEAIDRAVTKAQQELLSELLGEAVAVAMTPDSNTYVPAVPVSVIQRLQNKTNDGGSDGGL